MIFYVFQELYVLWYLVSAPFCKITSTTFEKKNFFLGRGLLWSIAIVLSPEFYSSRYWNKYPSYLSCSWLFTGGRFWETVARCGPNLEPLPVTPMCWRQDVSNVVEGWKKFEIVFRVRWNAGIYGIHDGLTQHNNPISMMFQYKV